MKNPVLKFLFLLFCFYSFNAKAQLPPYDSAYKLVFYDYFDSITPTIIDTGKWMRTPEWNQNSNLTGSMSWCVSPPDTLWDKAYIIRSDSDSTTIKVSGGTCKLITNRNIPIQYLGEVWNWLPCDTLNDSTLTGLPCTEGCQYFGADTITRCFRRDTLLFKYTTGMLYSRDKFRNGYFEMKFKLPAPANAPLSYTGFGPNFWLYGADENQNNLWSEIDMFEIDAFDASEGDTNRLTRGMHYKNGTDKIHHAYPPDGTFGNIEGGVWHKSAAWWTPEFVRIYLDDVLITNVENIPNIPPDSLVEMRLIVDLWSPAENKCTNFDTVHTAFPYIYEIDSIRVYQLKLFCDTDTIYCNTTASTFKSGLYNSLTIGDTSCAATFSGGANITGLGNDYVLLQEGFSFDDTSEGYFNVLRCDENQSPGRLPQPNTPSPPSDSWLIKFHYKPE